MNIRKFQISDLEACAALHHSSQRESEKGVIFDTDLDRHDLDHFINNWQEWTSMNDMDIIIAENNNDIVGLCISGKIRTRPDFDKGIVPKYGSEIYALYVHPDHFRKGTGRALFTHAVGTLKDQKQKSLLLWTLKKNKRACAFYDSFGGSKIGKKRVDMGEKSYADESCYGWLDITQIQK